MQTARTPGSSGQPGQPGKPGKTGKPGKPRKPSAVVVGGGISGLLAARELSAAGTAVTVLEASGRFGGCVGSHDVASLTLDSGAESFATRSTAVSDLIGELGLEERLVDPNPAGAWVQLPQGAVPLPKTGVLGIPADPGAPEVRRALGFRGSLRARLDKWLPASVGTDDESASVADVVTARMGRTVLERLVTPVVGGVHSADPAILDVDMVAPGLRRLVAEHGSLGQAVTQLRARAKSGSAVQSLAGGMHLLVDALVDELKQSKVQLLSDASVTGLQRDDPSGKWVVETAARKWNTDAVVVATPGPVAADLLSAAVPGLDQVRPPRGHQIKLVTLVLDMPELDTPTRGTGILVAPQAPGIEAKALTHATSKWAWLADEAGPGTHVLRLSYGRMSSGSTAGEFDAGGGDASGAGDAGGTAGPETDAELLDSAVSDAAALLGVHFTTDDLLGSGIVRWQGAMPFAAVGHRQRVEQAREMIGQLDALAVVGSWVAGTGLAAVTADTRQTVRSLAGKL
ncbi:protoporphyrinogen oxidase [Arthrobacter castelli]|uniref:protoporphyrinogen oxidase n=1 Tax=Arthrobacter castelli TaxID=271431 RepID=UPI00041FB5F3|nr:protoporphyrinogen oxidase [Arthrobacter castelli]